jgi:uridine phosphorylase
MIPNHGDKYEAEGLFSPEDALNAQSGGVPEIPPAVILGYQEELHAAVRSRASEPTTLVNSQRFYTLSETVGFIPVEEVGIGAPVTATVTENAIAAGAEVVIMLGGCASLQPEFPPDSALLPTGTIRDEGVSYHYIPADEPVTATPELVNGLEDALEAADFPTERGRTWTTSAMYRETPPEIERYQQEGVITLCMESAALWAVCQFRGVGTATVHQIGDYIAPDEWTPDSDDERGLPEMLEPTTAALETHISNHSDRL